MSAEFTNGGPAFPGGELRFDDGDCKTPYNAGMTLRDWFAGQALVSLAAEQSPEVTISELAKDAYRFADAMLAAREASE